MDAPQGWPRGERRSPAPSLGLVSTHSDSQVRLWFGAPPWHATDGCRPPPWARIPSPVKGLLGPVTASGSGRPSRSALELRPHEIHRLSLHVAGLMLNESLDDRPGAEDLHAGVQ